MKTALTKTTILASLLVVASAWIMQSCSGDKGDKGDKGDTGAGAPCTAASNANGVTITCGSDVYTLTNGEKGEKGESSCTVTNNLTDPETGLPAVGLNCGDGMKYIVQGGGSATGNIDCKLIVPEDDRSMGTVVYSSASSSPVYTGVSGGGARQIFGIQCGGENGAIAQIGFCGEYNDVFNPKTEKCVDEGKYAGGANNGTPTEKYIIVPGIGKCKLANGTIQSYVMSEQFCQDATGTSPNDEPYNEETEVGIGSILQPICSGAGTYNATNFCYGYEKGKSAGVIASKCGGLANSPTFETYQFCQQKTTSTGSSSTSTYSVLSRCGMSATTPPTSSQLNGSSTVTGIIGNGGNGTNGAGKYTENEFCQDETYTVLALCGGKTYTKDQSCLPENEVGGVCGDETYNMTRSFCASQDTRVYARCGITTTNTGVFNPTEKFCWSGDYSTTDTDSANTYGIIKDLCKNPDYVPANSSSSAVGIEYIGYKTTHFCSEQNNTVTPFCGSTKIYNTNLYTCLEKETQGGTNPTVDVLFGECIDGATVNKYNVNELACSTNKIYRTCRPTSAYTGTLPAQAFDGESITATNANKGATMANSVGYTTGSYSQWCAAGTDGAPQVTCRGGTNSTTGASVLVGKSGVVGCVCNLANDPLKPNWDGSVGTGKDGGECQACPSTGTTPADTWSPEGANRRGECVVASACPNGSSAKAATSTMAKTCTCDPTSTGAATSWQPAVQKDVDDSKAAKVGDYICK